MRSPLRALFALPLLAAAACGPQSSPDVDPFRQAIPRADDVKATDPTGAGATPTTQAAPGVVGQAPSTAYAKLYKLTRGLYDVVNYGSAAVLGSVWFVAHSPPTTLTEEEAIWGPGSEPLHPAEYRLRVSKVAEATYDWAWEGRPKGTSGDFRPVVTGRGYADRDARHGTGAFTIDFDAANELDPARLRADDESGVVVIEYDIRGAPILGGPRDITVRSTPSQRDERFVLHIARGEQGEGGGVDLTLHGDTDDSKATLPEDVVLVSRFRGDGAGRSDVKLSAGDLPAGVVVEMTECWSRSFERTYYTDSISIEPTSGDAASCAFADRAALP
ncbi:MAG: hypothetical protein IT374_16860 [Polyangiaceae bacterium]|nr:hypothetical protein [Polyangiaceae bacterium]